MKGLPTDEHAAPMQLRLAAAAVLVVAAAQDTTEKQIYVWHAPHHDYLYAPLRATVLNGLRGIGATRINIKYDGC